MLLRAVLVALLALIAVVAPASAEGESTRVMLTPPGDSGDDRERDEREKDHGNQTRVREPCANFVHDGTATGEELRIFTSGSYGFRFVQSGVGAFTVQATPYYCVKPFAAAPIVGTQVVRLSETESDAPLLP